MCNPNRRCHKKYDPITFDKTPDISLLARILNISSNPTWYFAVIFLNSYMMCTSLFSYVLGAFYEYKVSRSFIVLDLLYALDVLAYKTSTLLKNHFYPTIFGLRPKWIVITEVISLFSIIVYVDSLPHVIVCVGHLLRFLRLFRICHYNSDIHRVIARRTLMKLYKVFMAAIVFSLASYVTYCSYYCAHENCEDHTCQYFNYGNILDCVRDVPGYSTLF